MPRMPSCVTCRQQPELSLADDESDVRDDRDGEREIRVDTEQGEAGHDQACEERVAE